jgi:hypothetical protein
LFWEILHGCFCLTLLVIARRSSCLFIFVAYYLPLSPRWILTPHSHEFRIRGSSFELRGRKIIPN